MEQPISTTEWKAQHNAWVEDLIQNRATGINAVLRKAIAFPILIAASSLGDNEQQQKLVANAYVEVGWTVQPKEGGNYEFNYLV